MIIIIKKIIEQAKFTYSPLGKAFEEQTKKIKDQGEERVKVIKEHGKELVKSNKDVDKNNMSYKKLEDKIFNELSYKRICKIRNLGRQLIILRGKIVIH